jgi:2-hydroxychromene-2-carboxylate isomerase
MSGENASDPERFSGLCKELAVTPDRLEAQPVKDQLRKNTEEAAQRGVFGVPSLVADGEVFWGADAIDFFKAFLADPAVLRNDEIHRVDGLPTGARRQP